MRKSSSHRNATLPDYHARALTLRPLIKSCCRKLISLVRGGDRHKLKARPINSLEEWKALAS
jgi:hypothetical protein